MEKVIITRDIAEALEQQFYPSVSEQYENDESCDAVSISGIIDDERNIDYAKLESYLMNSWGYNSQEASETTQLAISKFNGKTESFEIKWVA